MLAVLGIAESSRATLLAELDRIGSNLLTVSAGQTFLGADSALPQEATAMIDRIGPVDSATSVSQTTATVRRTDRIDPAETGGIAVQAADPDLLDVARRHARGRPVPRRRVDGYPAVVLGSVAAERLGIAEPGASRSSSGSPTAGGASSGSWTRCRSRPSWTDPRWSAATRPPTLLDSDGAPTTIYVRAAPDLLDDVRAVLPATADPEHPEAIKVSRPSDAIEARAAAASAFTTLFLGLGAVAVLVGALGIANVMLMAVLERRNEIGLRRALGATRGHIVGQFLAEAVLLAGVGGVAGALLGSLVAAAYAISQGWLVALPVAGVVGGVLAATLVGALAGFYPALRAANTPPTDALRA